MGKPHHQGRKAIHKKSNGHNAPTANKIVRADQKDTHHSMGVPTKHVDVKHTQTTHGRASVEEQHSSSFCADCCYFPEQSDLTTECAYCLPLVSYWMYCRDVWPYLEHISEAKQHIRPARGCGHCADSGVYGYFGLLFGVLPICNMWFLRCCVLCKEGTILVKPAQLENFKRRQRNPCRHPLGLGFNVCCGVGC